MSCSFWSCLELSCSDFALVPPTHHVVYQCLVVMPTQPVCIYSLRCITTFASLACVSITVIIYIYIDSCFCGGVFPLLCVLLIMDTSWICSHGPLVVYLDHSCASWNGLNKTIINMYGKKKKTELTAHFQVSRYFPIAQNTIL